MKLVITLWITQMIVLVVGSCLIVSACSTKAVPPREVQPAPVYPNILDTMPQIALSAMDELEQLVALEVDEQQRAFIR